MWGHLDQNGCEFPSNIYIFEANILKEILFARNQYNFVKGPFPFPPPTSPLGLFGFYSHHQSVYIFDRNKRLAARFD